MNRVTVKESDLLVAGANYYYGIHLVHQGEAVANRGDNLASRGFDPAWTGTQWTLNNNAHGQIAGTILQHWTGATIDNGGNGNDDGRFFVAVLVNQSVARRVPLRVRGTQRRQQPRRGLVPRTGRRRRHGVQLRTSATSDSNPLNDWTAARCRQRDQFLATAATR